MNAAFDTSGYVPEHGNEPMVTLWSDLSPFPPSSTPQPLKEIDVTDQELGVASTAKSGRPQPDAGVAARPARVGFELGALAKPLAEQFAAQGLTIGPKSAARWQEAADAIHAEVRRVPDLGAGAEGL